MRHAVTMWAQSTMATSEVTSDEWKYSDGWALDVTPFTDITAATVDPYGQLLIIGSADGCFNFICVESGLPVPLKPSNRERFFLRTYDDSRIQAISCALFPYNVTRDRYRLLCAHGTASGLFEVYVISVKRNLPRSNDVTPRSLFLLVNKFNCTSIFPHSVNQEHLGIGDQGGTLCVCTQEMLAVSGGGNGRCALVVLYSTTYPFEDWDEDTIEGLGAPVTAVTAEQNIIAVGLANGVSSSCIRFAPWVRL
ncbi:hypothetical protein D915_003051 [Fasciola hepatica]|uniref:Uncharacterized protein n=1 Tax=Fasciola hepatica TaxID=6192 RepID=A0A4E0RV58_FASHE|nr:hypothetical protein D915_003051 [Fasciola hepatica]